MPLRRHVLLFAAALTLSAPAAYATTDDALKAEQAK